DAILGDDQEPDRMNGRDRTGWQDRTLNALLPTVLTERRNILEIAELVLVDRRLRTDRQGVANLRDDHADLTRRNLHHRRPRHRIDRPELESQAGSQQLGLIAGLALEGDGVSVAQFLPTEPLAHEADFRRPNGPERSPNNPQDYCSRNECDQNPQSAK